MELVLLLLLLLLPLLLFSWLSSINTPEDNREPYARDEQGHIWSLYVAGPVGNVPSHERFIHASNGGAQQGATPHQNPAVNTFTAFRWFLIFPFPYEKEERWYPITKNGIPIHLDALQQRIDQARLPRGQVVELTTMPRWAERQAIRRENGEQLGRGVPAGKLRKRGV